MPNLDLRNLMNDVVNSQGWVDTNAEETAKWVEAEKLKVPGAVRLLKEIFKTTNPITKEKEETIPSACSTRPIAMVIEDLRSLDLSRVTSALSLLGGSLGIESNTPLMRHLVPGWKRGENDLLKVTTALLNVSDNCTNRQLRGCAAFIAYDLLIAIGVEPQ